MKIIFAVLLFTQLYFSQKVIHKKTFGGSEYDYGITIKESVKSGYIIGGYTKSADGDINFNNGDYDFWLIKTDPSGNIEWEKTYGGSNFEALSELIITSDWHYLLLGSTYSGNITNGNSEITIKKIDFEGNLKWEKFYGGSYIDEASDLIQMSNGNFAVIGHSASTDGLFSENMGTFDMFTINLSQSGEINWSETFGYLNVDYSSTLIESKNILYVGGFTETFDSSDGNIINNGRIINYNLSGSFMGDWEFKGNKNDIIEDMIISSDGNLIVLLSSESSDGFIKSNYGDYDVVIMKISKKGEVIWANNYGGSSFDRGSKILQKSNGNLIVAANSNSEDNDVSKNYGSTDIWIFEADSLGKIIWEKSYGGSNFDEVNNIDFNYFGNLLVVGNTNSDDELFQSNNGKMDLFFLEIALNNVKKFKNLYLSKSVSGFQNNTTILSEMYNKNSKSYLDTIYLKADNNLMISGIELYLKWNPRIMDVIILKGNVTKLNKIIETSEQPGTVKMEYYSTNGAVIINNEDYIAKLAVSIKELSEQKIIIYNAQMGYYKPEFDSIFTYDLKTFDFEYNINSSIKLK